MRAKPPRDAVAMEPTAEEMAGAREIAGGAGRQFRCGIARTFCGDGARRFGGAGAARIADGGLYARAEGTLRTGNSGGVRQRTSAGFFAAQWGNVERRIAAIAGETRNVVRLGGDLPSCGNEELPQHDVCDAGRSARAV